MTQDYLDMAIHTIRTTLVKSALAFCFVTALSLASTVAAAAEQAKKTARIGVLSPFSPSTASEWQRVFLQGLNNRGWSEGKNVVIEYRYAEGKPERLPQLAVELVRLKVDGIVTASTLGVAAPKKATQNIPIVMPQVGDPVASGFVASLSNPGGNITGLTTVSPQLSGKQLEIFKETLPKLARAAVLRNPGNPANGAAFREMEVSGPALGVRVQSYEAANGDDLDRVFSMIVKAPSEGLLVLRDPLFVSFHKQIVDRATESRLPVMYGARRDTETGGLMSYGVDQFDMQRRAAVFVDKILKGTKTADLPVEQPTKFEFVINLKAAKQIG